MLPKNVPNPQVKLPYTYLMAWFVLHCPSLMTPGEELVEGASAAILCRYEDSRWTSYYLAMARKMVHRYDAYNLFRCFPHIPGTDHGVEFTDDGSTFSSLGAGIFRWLVTIRPSHLLYRWVMTAFWSLTFQVTSPVNLATTSCMLAIPTCDWDLKGV